LRVSLLHIRNLLRDGVLRQMSFVDLVGIFLAFKFRHMTVISVRRNTTVYRHGVIERRVIQCFKSMIILRKYVNTSVLLAFTNQASLIYIQTVFIHNTNAIFVVGM
jgi:hypothetical protein